MSDSRVPKISTERFFELMQKQNEQIAAAEAQKRPPAVPKTDLVREQRQEDRRTKYGQLRARAHQGKRNKRASPTWDAVYIPPSDE